MNEDASGTVGTLLWRCEIDSCDDEGTTPTTIIPIATTKLLSLMATSPTFLVAWAVSACLILSLLDSDLGWMILWGILIFGGLVLTWWFTVGRRGVPPHILKTQAIILALLAGTIWLLIVLYKPDPGRPTFVFWYSVGCVGVLCLLAAIWNAVEWLGKTRSPLMVSKIVQRCSLGALAVALFFVAVAEDSNARDFVIGTLVFFIPLALATIVVQAVRRFKTNMETIHQNDGTSKDAPSLRLFERMDRIFSCTLMAVAVLFTILFVTMIILMAQQPDVSILETLISVLIMGWIYFAFFYLLAMFFVSHRLRPRRLETAKKCTTDPLTEPLILSVRSDSQDTSATPQFSLLIV